MGALEQDIADVLTGLRPDTAGRAQGSEPQASLKAEGYTLHAQVGCGGYRIDLAVVDPAHPDRYLLGIESDGAAYGAAPSARDRDRLRRQVLEGLGWRLHRIWSADWQTFRQREIERLKEALAAPAPEVPAAPPIPEPKGPSVDAGSLDQGYRTAAAPLLAAEPELLAPPAQPGLPYLEVPLQPVAGAEPETFYLPASRTTTEAMVRQLLQEAPLHRDDLDGRIVRAWGWSALTRRGRSHMDPILQDLARRGLLRLMGDFVWRGDQDPEAHDTFRLAPEAGPREAERIAPEEIASAMAVVLHASIALDESSLLRETARLLGYRRVTTRTTEALKAGLGHLEKRHPGCTCEGGYRWVKQG